MDKHEIMGAVEAILYVAGEPVEEESLRMALELTPDALEDALSALHDQYEFERRGIRLLRFGRSVQLSTRPEYADYVERLLQPIQRQNLSQAAMETLAVIAYRQPATRGDVEAVRGVKCDYSVQSLLNKGLIMEAGRRDTLGRPILFCTTDLFLRHFGISTLDELPQIDFSVPAQAPPIPEDETDAVADETPSAEPGDESSLPMTE
ncbi:SMC-Scp complex subunit ScpB [Eubacteriales bacterium OttesenSCG-928-A19]|nr:SMC-Scp complex subunit ScpB [Eubacteriales bacterium OttesenSCG-928-A19]